MSEINIYCDESCHLENDNSNVMVLGAIMCPDEIKREIFQKIRKIKQKHKLKKFFEIKWTKVSSSKKDFYLDLINYFFDEKALGFRAVIIDKAFLNHDKFFQTHDEFYYKMYYYLLKAMFDSTHNYNIYLDIKDTKGYEKTQELKKICNYLSKERDFTKKIIEKIQEVRSNEIELIQIADLLIGAVAYINRGLTTNPAKLEIIEKIKLKSGYPLTQSTFLRESKFNLFKWKPQDKIKVCE